MLEPAGVGVEVMTDGSLDEWSVETEVDGVVLSELHLLGRHHTGAFVEEAHP